MGLLPAGCVRVSDSLLVTLEVTANWRTGATATSSDVWGTADWRIQASCDDTSPSQAIAWAFPAHADGYPTGSGPGELVITVNVQVDDGLAIGIGGDTWTYVYSWQQ